MITNPAHPPPISPHFFGAFIIFLRGVNFTVYIYKYGVSSRHCVTLGVGPGKYDNNIHIKMALLATLAGDTFIFFGRNSVSAEL